MSHGIDDDRHALLITYAVSFLCHLVFFAALIFAPELKPVAKTYRPVINVNLVTLPKPQEMPGSDSQAVAPPELQPAKQKKVTVPEISIKNRAKSQTAITKAVSAAPRKKKLKRSLKKKTFKPSKIVKSAIAQIKKNIENYSAGKKPAVDLIAEDIIEIINKNKLAEKKIAS